MAALEIVFLNTNPASTLLLGQARGAALCALADSAAVRIPTALIKAVVGTGRAARSRCDDEHLLSLDARRPDSADALACAICHAHAGPLRTSSAAWARRWAAADPAANGRLVG